MSIEMKTLTIGDKTYEVVDEYARNNKAPAYTYGTTDLTAGSSSLETGKLYFVYE